MNVASMHTLPQPARYRPFLHGRYDVLPRLRPLGHDFGNGSVDGFAFQFDDRFNDFRTAKHAARQSQPARHVLVSPIDPQIEAAAADCMVRHLATEWPDHFKITRQRGTLDLHARLTGDHVRMTEMNGGLAIDADASTVRADPPATSLLDALAIQMQEDFAIVQRMNDGRHTMAAMHICLPAHWRPETKVGRSFAQVHQVVPGMEAFNERQDMFIDQMIRATDGLVRFTWGLQRGDGLNGHPDSQSTPPSAGNDLWHLRIERQVILGLPDVKGAIFLIRTYLTPLIHVKAIDQERAALASAISSMSDESARYKGLANDRDELVSWLTAP